MTRLLGIFLCLLSLSAWSVEFSSGEQQTTVVELYTSEGCSSCPPADRWLSLLASDPRVFDSLIPLAFHVDYWDELGWSDRFARAEYSQRQRNLVKQGRLSQVYTPGLVIDSQEWHGWFSGERELPVTTASAGELKAHFKNGVLAVSFIDARQYVLNVAVLGMGLNSDVSAGENRGRRLQHDFVVLDLYQQAGIQTWQLRLDKLPQRGQRQTALAVWLSPPQSLQVIQAAAAFID
jgi:hypothetical protein